LVFLECLVLLSRRGLPAAGYRRDRRAIPAKTDLFLQYLATFP